MRITPKDIEEVFLLLLPEDNDKNYISQKLQYFRIESWQRLSELSIKSGLFPLFYNRLLSLNLENIPCEFILRLKHLYLINLKRNIILEQELFRIISYFQKLDVPVIPLKGPVLTEYLYNDLSLRQASVDLDLLVKYENIKELAEVFKKAGYSLVNNSDKSIREKFAYAPVVGLKNYVKGLGLVILDLHRDMRRFFTQDLYPEIWRNVRLINLKGYKILMPFNEDLLIYLSLVSIFWKYVELKYIYDAHRLISKWGGNLDWQGLMRKAKRAGLSCQLYFALKLSQELFHTDIPKEFLMCIRPNLLKERLLSLWIDHKKLFSFKEKAYSSYIWRYFICGYISSRNIFDYSKKFYRWLLSPTEGTAKTYSPLEFQRLRYYLVIKRLLKPFFPKKGLVKKRRWFKLWIKENGQSQSWLS